MRPSLHDKLRRALDRRDIPWHIQKDILNEVFLKGSTTSAAVKDDVTWDSLLNGVQHSIAVLTSNRSRWPAHMVPLYEEYRQIMHDTKAEIIATRATLLPDPDNPKGARLPATLDVVRKLAARRNDKLRKTGAPLMPACTDHWPSWVSPAKVSDLIERFERAYDLHGGGRGKRLIPFATTTVTKSLNRTIVRHRAFIDSQRNAILAADPDADRENGRVHQRYGALHLCALRQAEMWLDNYEREVRKRTKHPVLDPVPVNWLHLLEPELRRRVRAADENPAGVTPEGLGSFLID